MTVQTVFPLRLLRNFTARESARWTGMPWLIKCLCVAVMEGIPESMGLYTYSMFLKFTDEIPNLSSKIWLTNESTENIVFLKRLITPF